MIDLINHVFRVKIINHEKIKIINIEKIRIKNILGNNIILLKNIKMIENMKNQSKDNIVIMKKKIIDQKTIIIEKFPINTDLHKENVFPLIKKIWIFKNIDPFSLNHLLIKYLYTFLRVHLLIKTIFIPTRFENKLYIFQK